MSDAWNAKRSIEDAFMRMHQKESTTPSDKATRAAEEYAKQHEAAFHPAISVRYLAFLSGVASERERIQTEVLEWLASTGVIPRGTSYFSELVDGILETPVDKTREAFDRAQFEKEENPCTSYSR